ncbi:hypothetical protein [Ornithinibacillus halophilus]|uniref:Uncharacterized protein n=1 Tax=Ornithinibacillus halophilus TaxID=930117 RepID=A0A1M5I8J3_9BACI|nr:hypothetical protein [Ornithinibacillus halophilus]SHG24541.1 hypothetical protein SAMN05216225_102221 [Ornithinibacillus halophilus]
MFNSIVISSLIPWIKMPHLQSLGITEEILLYGIVIGGIIGCYFIIQPIIRLILSLKAERLLSYLVSSLLFFVLFFSVILIKGEITVDSYKVLGFALQGLSILGGGLLLMNGVKWIVLNVKTKKSA